MHFDLFFLNNVILKLYAVNTKSELETIIQKRIDDINKYKAIGYVENGFIVDLSNARKTSEIIIAAILSIILLVI